jgi:hypothetical protein
MTWANQSICQVGQDIRNSAAANLWTIVGEWTTASTDCARRVLFLNLSLGHEDCP